LFPSAFITEVIFSFWKYLDRHYLINQQQQYYRLGIHGSQGKRDRNQARPNPHLDEQLGNNRSPVTANFYTVDILTVVSV
jgi:hypothetical protein